MATEDDKRAAQAAKEVASAFSGVTKVIGRFIPGFDKLGTEITEMTTAFATLSNTGNAFNNDMIGMRVAAAEARMSLTEYTEVVKANSKAFSGLGGSISQGTKVFGDFSKAFFESGLTENLRQMGYTSKDLNEILATQIGFQKATTDNTVEGQMRTAKAAAELGTELDLIAKLTGVSRREQEEKLKKAAVDGQVEAKFRLIGAQQGADAEKEARANYAKQLAQAQSMGQEQLFKEFFATGTATSQEAQQQLALFGEASMQTAESARSLSYAQIEASKAAMEAAKIANMKNQNDVTLNTIAATGVGTAAKAVAKNIEINDAAYQGLKTFMKGTEDVAEAMTKQRIAIEKEQKTRDAFTETLITTNNRLQDFRAGVVGAIGAGIKKSGEEGALKTANKFVTGLPGSVPATATNEQLAEKYKQDLGKMNIAYKAKQLATEGAVGDFFKGLDKLANISLESVWEAGKKIGKVWTEVSDQIDANRKVAKTEPPKRQGGSIEMAGTMFEDWGKGTLVELHGMESVIKPDQMMNFAKGIGQQGASIAFNNMKGMLAGQDKSASKGIDLAKISNEIKTNVSKVEITNWPKDLISKVEIKTTPPAGGATKPATTTEEDKAKAAAEAKEREKKTAEDRRKEEEQEAKFRLIGIRDGAEAEKKAREDYVKQRAQQESSTQSRTEKAAKAAEEVTIKSGDTLISLAKKYNTSVAELMKANPALKDANNIVTGAKLTIPGQEKKVISTEDTAKKAQTEAEQAQIKQQEQEKKFRQIGIEKGEEAEKEARAQYAKSQAQDRALFQWREDELKARIIGIREGVDAEKKFRDDLKQNIQQVKKSSETTVTIDGKKVDPNSPEGQAAIKQMDAVRTNLENSMGSMFHLTKDRIADLAKTNLAELKNTQTKFAETKLTVNGKNIDPNSTAGKEAMAQIEEAKSRMFGLFGNIKTNFEDVEKVSKNSNEELKTMFTDMIPITEMQSQQSEFKSKFTDEQKKFIEDYQGMSKDNQDFMRSALERSNGIDRESIEKHNGIVADLQKKKNERELTAEEEHQLSESEAIARNISEDVRRRQEQLDMISNISNLGDQLELERLDQQARKELDLMKGADAEKLDATKSANDFINEQFLMANDAILDSVGGMTDAAIAAQDIFMQEINTLFDMPIDAAAQAQDALMQEANALFDMPSEAAAQAQDAFMQEVNALFDIPERDEFEEDEYGEGGEAIGGEMDSAFAEDEYAALEDLTNQIQGLKEFEEDEYGEGGEDVVLPEEPQEDYISLAMKDFADQVQGLKEFEEDEYGEGGEAIGGEMDSAFAEDEDSYVAQALQDFQDLIPDTMADDAAFASGPGDASVAGMDYASGPGDASVAGIDFTPAMDELAKTLPQAQSLSKESPKSTPQFSKIDMGGFTLGPDGMPIAKPKAQGQAAANAVKQENDTKKAEDKKTAEAKKAEGDKKEKDSDKKQGEGEKRQTKTLDDVVKSLDQLNMNIGRLTTKVEEASKQQVQATKSLNGNLFNV